ncbi:uncharacterized protein LOC126354540 [Schistocerca gregaria]|uniref:uncharacterized protein LOC126354540 n=1 Tax=Schistocerca gregaria TaxID=7010 RepID=UPI00211DBA0B|nr:uncharacterized protein LOC126354540 [Schistocerca gregaria]
MSSVATMVLVAVAVLARLQLACGAPRSVAGSTSDGDGPRTDAELLRQASAAASLHERSLRHFVSPRTRRAIHHHASLKHHRPVLARDAGELALCKYAVHVDAEDEGITEEGVTWRRVPATITEIECRAQGCRCTEAGDYRCTQLTGVLQVAYVDAATGRLIDTARRDVRAGCVCAARAALHVQAYPAGVDD